MSKFSRLENAIIVLLTLGVALLYAYVGTTKHNHFQTFAWDTSVFVQQAYLASQLKAPLSSLHHGMHGLADHFQVTFLIFGGLFFKIWGNPESLFLLQALASAFSGFILFLISRLVLQKTALSKNVVFFCSLALTLTYFFSVSFQAMMTDEFHNEPLAVVPLLLMVYFHLKKNQVKYWLSFIVLLLTKEIYGLLAIPFATYVFFSSREYKKAVATGLLGTAAFLLLVFKIMPELGGSSEYFHFDSGNNPSHMMNKFTDNPALLATNFFDNQEKRKTILVSVADFSFLPLLSPTGLILPAASLAIRFYDDTTPRLYEFNNHYAVPFLPFLAVGALFGLVNLLKFSKKSKLSANAVGIGVSVSLLILTGSQDLILHGPLNSLGKSSFYRYSGAQSDALELVKMVPPDISVASQNSLLPHLSERQNFYLLPEVGNAQYIAVDLTDGPNKFSPATQPEIKNLINGLIKNGKYKIIWQQNQAILLQKIDNHF